MNYSTLTLSKALAGLVAALSLSAVTAPAQVNISADLSVSGPLSFPGGGLKGEYWKRGVNTILTDGNNNPANRIDTQINGFGTPDGTFRATLFNYMGNDLSPVRTWLAGDVATYSGSSSNLDDGAFRFSGFINITAAGTLNIGTTSDDGVR